jgi:hypothetical protein
MLASNPDYRPASGTLGSDVQRPFTFFYEVIAFIASELPLWRDRSDRPSESAETRLTTQLCGHLNSASRHSDGFDILQFRVEEPDEQERSRTIDLIPAPSGVTIVVAGRRYTDFEALLPIECQRLPTPVEGNRDEREYVFSENSTTGGIQRFKSGHHGAIHSLAAMIGFVQKESISFWHERTVRWIRGLSSSNVSGWTDNDLLHLIGPVDTERRLAVFESCHDRATGLSSIELRHLWVEMN